MRNEKAREIIAKIAPINKKMVEYYKDISQRIHNILVSKGYLAEQNNIPAKIQEWLDTNDANTLTLSAIANLELMLNAPIINVVGVPHTKYLEVAAIHKEELPSFKPTFFTITKVISIPNISQAAS